MRVALVIERFEDAAGGGEQVAWNVARELARAGDTVEVWCRLGDDAPGIRVRRVRTPAFWQPLRVRRFATQVASALSRERYDVVHAFSKVFGADVLHCGGGSHADYMEQTYGAAGARWRRFSPRHRTLLSLERQVFANPALIGECVSERVKHELGSRYGLEEGRLPVLPCGVDCARFAPENQGDARAKLRAEWGLRDETSWLFAGSGWRRKGFDLALEALARVRDRDTRLIVVGKDDPAPWRSTLARLEIAERVHFLGTRRDMEHVYAACDGLLFPSRYDAFGLVCLEAAAAERAVIVSTRAGASELFEGCGRVVEACEDAAAFAKAMDGLATRAARQALARPAREMARQYDWPARVAALRQLYDQVTARAPTGGPL